jgi:polycystin 1L2
LSAIRIWHDNSGRANKASWYLKYIIVTDLSIGEKFYFICEDWLAVDKSDFRIERILPVCGEKQQTEFSYLLQKQTKQNLMDGHLWFSILARPVQSTFSRLDRLTCAFDLLFLSMLMNILYYGVSDTRSGNGLQIGPMNITPEQVSNLILFSYY